jgi:hypothetical protein
MLGNTCTSRTEIERVWDKEKEVWKQRLEKVRDVRVIAKIGMGKCNGVMGHIVFRKE